MRSALFYILFSINFLLEAQVPTFQWAKALSGSAGEVGRSIAVDDAGNVYTAGTFSGTVDFDPGPGVYNLSSVGTNDAYLSKLDVSGNFVWAKSFAVNCYYHTLGIAVDTIGNLFVAGQFFGTVDFDPGISTYTLAANGYDIYISKFDPMGNYLWTKSFGGSIQDDFAGLTLDTAGNIYITGYGGGFFILKLDSGGNLIWTKATASSIPHSIAVDLTGNVYTTGDFSAPSDFDPGLGTYTLSANSGRDMFISKLDANGNFVWAKQIGGTGLTDVYGRSITVDLLGNVYTTGSFDDGIADFDPGIGTYTLTSSNPVGDIFISKLDVMGNFVWAKNFGVDAGGGGAGYAIVLDKNRNVYTTGQFQGSADFDPGVGTYTLNSIATVNMFLSKLDSSGNFVWALKMGGTSGNEANSICVDGLDNVYTTGWFGGTTDFDPGTGAYNLSATGTDCDAFIHKLGQSAVGIKENNETISSLMVYPNPNIGSFKLKINKEINKGEMILFNSLGQKVHEQKIIKGENNIIPKELSDGLYNYIILEDNIQIKNGKIVIE